MARLQIGLVLEVLGLPVRAALAHASQLGVQGVQFSAHGALRPQQLGGTARRELRHLLQSHRLDLIALTCPLRKGLDEVGGLDERMEQVRQAMVLSADLGPRLVALAAGVVPADQNDSRRTLLGEALGDLARFGDRIGVRLALEAGRDDPPTLLGLLRGFDSASLGVQIDPASALTEGRNPALDVRTYHGYLFHIHARDAQPRRSDRLGLDVSLGAGEVDWFGLLGVLDEVGYQGFLTIQRGPCTDPLGEARRAVSFLKKLGVGPAIRLHE